MKWIFEVRDTGQRGRADLKVPIVQQFLVGESGIEIELGERQSIWHLTYRHDDLSLSFSAASSPNQADMPDTEIESNRRSKVLGPICQLHLATLSPSRPFDGADALTIGRNIREALRANYHESDFVIPENIRAFWGTYDYKFTPWALSIPIERIMFYEKLKLTDRFG